MTNEAQANIVVAQAKKMLPMMKSTLGESVERYAEFFKKSLLNMAEWKDQQFKEYLENTIKAYKCRGEKFFAAEIKALENIINELFKED